MTEQLLRQDWLVNFAMGCCNNIEKKVNALIFAALVAMNAYFSQFIMSTEVNMFFKVFENIYIVDAHTLLHVRGYIFDHVCKKNASASCI